MTPPSRALRVRKKTGGENMPVQLIGDLLASELAHMQPYIRFCSCQLNAAALLQSKTHNQPDFKDFLKVRALDSGYCERKINKTFAFVRCNKNISASVCLLLSRRLQLTTAVKECRCPASSSSPCRGLHVTLYSSKMYAEKCCLYVTP